MSISSPRGLLKQRIILPTLLIARVKQLFTPNTKPDPLHSLIIFNQNNNSDSKKSNPCTTFAHVYISRKVHCIPLPTTEKNGLNCPAAVHKTVFIKLNVTIMQHCVFYTRLNDIAVIYTKTTF